MFKKLNAIMYDVLYTVSRQKGNSIIHVLKILCTRNWNRFIFWM